MDGFQHPIFSSSAADARQDAYLDNDFDDIFVDDFMSGGDDSSAMPPMGFDDFATPLPPFSQPMQAPALHMDSIGVSNGIFTGSDAAFQAQTPAAPVARPSGAALLQQSAYSSNAGPATAAPAATLAGIAANPDTSKYVASAALAATQAANTHLQSSGSSGSSQAAAAPAAVATSKTSAASRARRTSARAASEKIKEVVAEERSAVKRPHEPQDAGSDGDDDDEDDEDEDDGAGSGRSKRRRSMNQSERQARSRERNRVHARKSRLRKKFFVDSLKSNLSQLEEENAKMREFLKAHTGKTFEELSAAEGVVVNPKSSAAASDAQLLAGPSRAATRQLEDPDYKLVQALTVSQQNFVVSDPNLPDNPIVFASSGFYGLTGYSPAEVVGRNCRFLQGPGTDPSSIAVIRRGIKEGRDVAVCLINYRKDGTPFWNQFFVAPLRGVDGRIVNFVGVQCEVSEKIAQQSLTAAKLAAAQSAAAKAQFGTK